MKDFNDDFIPLQVPANGDDQSNDTFTQPVEEASTSDSQQNTPPTVRNVKDLVNTLARMNKRLVQVEAENAKLRKELEKKAGKRDVVQMISNVESLGLPKNGLFSDSFIVRAISIYGHWFVANLIISIIMSIISFILFTSLFQQLAANLSNAGF